ncbi:hypothetical protein SKAU_G00111120 [Synaphobranchus kaupii]|uniref:Uncharacterized protein n=1 Tax=Synaphobranchus kaupii TaxID=118154 RepID=A0A9Q1G168_SYNKA|nr:hypothetical protein SKAU_G00111120 [Synaphobranchus kaupii]
MAGVHQSKGSRGRRLAAPDRALQEGLVWRRAASEAPRSGGTKARAQLKDVNSVAFCAGRRGTCREVASTSASSGADGGRAALTVAGLAANPPAANSPLTIPPFTQSAHTIA